jgi:RHH-type proline utilization regulon transcriptional repressor/proline dehydrogenase/delta 1-pyrroline-5-carboxylate dehydrogenase
MRADSARVILAGEKEPLHRYLASRTKAGFRINLNHLGEAVLGEEEAQHRLDAVLGHLADPAVNYISVKISAIYSQINLIAWDHTLAAIQERLRLLYRAAQKGGKFVNLDMEEYRDLALTMAAFRAVLDEPEFRSLSAGIVLQAYLPDSFAAQKELTEWAKQRVAAGGAPIKIRLVKGANLAMEKVEAEMHGWNFAPYPTKATRMPISAACSTMAASLRTPQRCAWVSPVTISSMSLWLSRCVSTMECGSGWRSRCWKAWRIIRPAPCVTPPELCCSTLLRCRAMISSARWPTSSGAWMRTPRRKTSCATCLPCAPARRSGTTRSSVLFKAGTTVTSSPPNHAAAARWNCQPKAFTMPPTRTSPSPQHAPRSRMPFMPGSLRPFLPCLISKTPFAPLPQRRKTGKTSALQAALPSSTQPLKSWSSSASISLACLRVDGKKAVPDADGEVSEAIDFARYYARTAEAPKGVKAEAMGIVAVVSPWNFPYAIPAGGVLAALMAGNSVIFKPARVTSQIAYLMVQQLWQAGVPREVLHFFPLRWRDRAKAAHRSSHRSLHFDRRL